MSETKEFKQYRKKTCPYCGSSKIFWEQTEPVKECDGVLTPDFVIKEICTSCNKTIKTTELYNDCTIIETVDESDYNPDTYKEAWQKLSDTYGRLLTNYNTLNDTHEALVNEYHKLEKHNKQLLNSIYGSKSPLLYDENDGIGVCESDDEKTIDYEAVIKTKDSHIEELENMCNTFLEGKQMWEGKYKSLLQDVEWLIHRLRTGEE